MVPNESTGPVNVKRPVVAVVGPTATGKSALAVEVALKCGGEVINADSRLFYRGFDIGTSKPSKEEQKGVPHHLIDFLGPSDSYNLALFMRDAASLIEQVAGRGSLPVVCGGTGQYVRALLEGWHVPQTPPDPRLRAELEELLASKGLPGLVERLRSITPDAGQQVDIRNPRRVIRAIESAASPAALHGGDRQEMPARPANRRPADDPPMDALVIGLTMERPELYRRVDSRIGTMMEAGWLDEVRGLLGRGTPQGCPAMSSIGYRSLAAYLNSEMRLEDALQTARRDTRRLIRQQYNWFKLDDPRISWLEAGPGAVAEAVAMVRSRWPHVQFTQIADRPPHKSLHA